MKLSQIFSDGAIFPAHRNLCVFGEGRGAVRVTFAGNTYCSAAKDGRFRVFLPPMPYGGPYELTVSDADGEVKITDIHIGEVYLMAGQSNMQFRMRDSDFPKDRYFDDPFLRVWTNHCVDGTEVYHPEDGWVGVTKENAGDFSAIGVMTGEELRKKKNVPIGIITCYQGASVIESWLPEEVAGLPCFYVPDSEKFADHFQEKYSAWNHPGDLYHAVFSRIVPYPVSGAVWYQGESDASDGEAPVYGEELRALIGVWRTDLLDPTLPFYVIQIADCDSRSWDCWRAIQKAQAEIADDEKRICCVVSRDLCESTDIHPTEKYGLSKRLAEKICQAEQTFSR